MALRYDVFHDGVDLRWAEYRAWAEQVGERGAMSHNAITSAGQLLAVEIAREEIGVEESAGIATDIFLWGKGPSPIRRGTRIGGLPYLAKTAQWPCDGDGQALAFLFQLDFGRSRDILDVALPGEVLLAFGPRDFLKAGGGNLVWLWCNALPPEELVEAAPCPQFPEFYGARHRTFDLPIFTDALDEHEVGYLIDIVRATKIGGLPVWIQSEPSRQGFLAQMFSVQALSEREWPWVNRKDPMPAWGADGVHTAENSFVIGDMGGVQLWWKQGKLRSSTEGY